jgi:hypothetical protein
VKIWTYNIFHINKQPKKQHSKSSNHSVCVNFHKNRAKKETKRKERNNGQNTKIFCGFVCAFFPSFFKSVCTLWNFSSVSWFLPFFVHVLVVCVSSFVFFSFFPFLCLHTSIH